MPCPTCDHTMTRLGCQLAECSGTWACPRCGTLKIGHLDGHFDIIVPALVERCRAFEPHLDVQQSAGAAKNYWRSLGVRESINLPENRS